MSKFNYELFTKHLRAKQFEKRLSATAAAKEIGISKATMSRLNRSVGTPDIYSYFLCCKWLKVNMQFYFTLN